MKKWILNTLLGLSLFAAAQRGGAQGAPLTSQTAKIWNSGKAQDAVTTGWEEAIEKVSAEYGLKGISLEIVDQLPEGAQIVFHEGFKTATIQLDKNFAKTEFPWRYGIVAHEIGHQFLNVITINNGMPAENLWKKLNRGFTFAESQQNEQKTDSIAAHKTNYGRILQGWFEKRHAATMKPYITSLNTLLDKGYAKYITVTTNRNGKEQKDSILQIYYPKIPDALSDDPDMGNLLVQIGFVSRSHAQGKYTVSFMNVPFDGLLNRISSQIEADHNAGLSHKADITRVRKIKTWMQALADNAAKDTYRHR